jgi:hypothetical protein
VSVLARRKERSLRGEEARVTGEPAGVTMRQFAVAVAAPVWRSEGEDDQRAFSGEGMGVFGAGGEWISMDAWRTLARRTPTTANSAYEEQVTDVRRREVGDRS